MILRRRLTIKTSFKLKIIIRQEARKKDKSDAKKIKETVDVPKNPKRAIVFDYGAVDVLKAFGVQDRIIGLPKGEKNAALPEFLSEFKDDKYINTGNLIQINFDKIAKLNQRSFIFLEEQQQ